MITTKLITVRITNTTRPTAVLPPTREVAEGLDHLPAASRSGVAVEQHDPGGGHVERQAQQGGHQQHGGKTEKSSGRLLYIATSITIDRGRDVEGEEQVEQETGSGSTIIDRMTMISSGAASWRRFCTFSMLRRESESFIFPGPSFFRLPGIEIRRNRYRLSLRRQTAVGDPVAELIDPGHHLGHRGIGLPARCAQLTVGMAPAPAVAPRAAAPLCSAASSRDLQGHRVAPPWRHHRRPCVPRRTERDREVRRVGHHHVGFRNLRHHAPASHLALVWRCVLTCGSPSLVSWLPDGPLPFVMRRRLWYCHSWKGTSMSASRREAGYDQQRGEQHRGGEVGYARAKRLGHQGHEVVPGRARSPRCQCRRPGLPEQGLTISREAVVENIRSRPLSGFMRVRSGPRALGRNHPPAQRERACDGGEHQQHHQGADREQPVDRQFAKGRCMAVGSKAASRGIDMPWTHEAEQAPERNWPITTGRRRHSS